MDSDDGEKHGKSAEISNDGSPNSPDFSSVQFTQFLNVSSDSDGGSSDENENGKSGKKSHSEEIKNTSAKSERSKARTKKVVLKNFILEKADEEQTGATSSSSDSDGKDMPSTPKAKFSKDNRELSLDGEDDYDSGSLHNENDDESEKIKSPTKKSLSKPAKPSKKPDLKAKDSDKSAKVDKKRSEPKNAGKQKKAPKAKSEPQSTPMKSRKRGHKEETKNVTVSASKSDTDSNDEASTSVQSKRSKKGEASDKGELRLSKLRKYARLAGLGISYTKLLANESSNGKKVKILENWLTERGLSKPFTLEKAKALKEQREHEQEMADISSNVIFESKRGGRVTRGSMRNEKATEEVIVRRPISGKGSNTSDSGDSRDLGAGDSEEDEGPRDVRRRGTGSVFAGLAGIVSSDEGESDNEQKVVDDNEPSKSSNHTLMPTEK